jgi:hypothetical protein
LKLVRFPARSPLPIAAFAFYVAFPKSSISLDRDVFYLARPTRYILACIGKAYRR